MPGRKLILNDGTILEGSEAGYADGFLWLYLVGLSIQQAAAIAFNPDKTRKIIFQYDTMQDTYDGFTDCVDIHMNYDGSQVAVCMKKGVDANVER